MNAGAKEPRASARGRTPGRDLCFLWGVCQRESTVRAKPSVVVTEEMDMYSVNNTPPREQPSSHKIKAIPLNLAIHEG